MMNIKKAQKITTFRDAFFTTIEYEYRGCIYDVTYSNSWQACCTPAYIQHRDEQEKIDKMLDNPAPFDGQSMEEQLDEIWGMMGW